MVVLIFSGGNFEGDIGKGDDVGLLGLVNRNSWEIEQVRTYEGE